MTPNIATFVFSVGILSLYLLDRDRSKRTSPALWIPTAWLLINGSRPVSQWLSAFGFGDSAPSVDSPDQYLDGSPVDRDIFTLLIVLGVAVLLWRGQKVGRLLRANVPVVVFFFYCAVSIFWSDFPFVALKRWIKALGDLVMILVVLTDLDWFNALKRLLARVGFLLVPLSVLLIKYYPDMARVFDNVDGQQSFTGVTMGKNILGMICMVLGLAAEWRVCQALFACAGNRRTRELVAHGAVLGMVIWLFLLANSMTSLSCFLMASGLMMAARVRVVMRRPAFVHIIVVALVCTSAAALFFDMAGGALSAMGRDPTLTGRTEVWKDVLALVQNPLLGTGFESFWLGTRLQTMWSIYWWHPNEAHNGYLEFYLNLGWIGITLFAVVLVTGYRNAFQGYRSEPQMGSLRLAYCVIAVLGNFTEASMKMLNPVWILFLAAVIAIPFESAPSGLMIATRQPLMFGAGMEEA